MQTSPDRLPHASGSGALRRVIGSDVAGATLLAIVAFLVYHPLLTLPPVQDDWGVFRLFWEDGVLHGVLSAATPQSGLFFRPLPWLLFGIQYLLLGDDLHIYRTGLILLHAASGFLGYLLLTRVTGSRIVALSAAVISVGASTVHLDSLSWMVGIYDVGGMFFAMLSLFLFIQGKHRGSWMAFACAALTKESTLVLPLAAAGIALVVPMPVPPRRGLIGHFVIAALMIFGRGATLGMDLHPGSPYALSLSPGSLVSSGLRFAAWGLQGVVPVPSLSKGISPALLLGVLLLCSSLLMVVLRDHPIGRRRKGGRLLAFLAWWGVVSILPALPLADHPFRYYLTPALPALSTVVLLGLREWGFLLRKVRLAVHLLLILLPAGGVLAGACHIQTVIGAGIFQIPLPGENRIPGKGAEVRLVRETLLRLHPSLPRGSRIAFEGVDTKSFDGNSGPRYWYRDPAITVENRTELSESLRGLRDSGRSPDPRRPVFLFVMEMKGIQTTGRLLEQPVDFPADLP